MHAMCIYIYVCVWCIYIYYILTWRLWITFSLSGALQLEFQSFSTLLVWNRPCICRFGYPIACELAHLSRWASWYDDFRRLWKGEGETFTQDLGCLMVILWLSYGCLMVILWLSYSIIVILWLSYSYLMVILWLSYGYLMVILWLSYEILKAFHFLLFTFCPFISNSIYRQVASIVSKCKLPWPAKAPLISTIFCVSMMTMLTYFLRL